MAKISKTFVRIFSSFLVFANSHLSSVMSGKVWLLHCKPDVSAIPPLLLRPFNRWVIQDSVTLWLIGFAFTFNFWVCRDRYLHLCLIPHSGLSYLGIYVSFGSLVTYANILGQPLDSFFRPLKGPSKLSLKTIYKISSSSVSEESIELSSVVIADGKVGAAHKGTMIEPSKRRVNSLQTLRK